MSQIIAISTQKGGEGKTTTAITLGAYSCKLGLRTLLIDMDSQCNLSYITGTLDSSDTSFDLLTREKEAKDCIKTSPFCDVIPATKELSKIDYVLSDAMGKPLRLRKSLEPIHKYYDLIIIDCPPALGLLTSNALTAANKIIIPAQADISSLQGIANIAEVIKEAREYTNPGIEIAGILLTRAKQRTNFTQEIKRQLNNDIAPLLKTKLFHANIRESIKVKEANFMQIPLFEYAPKDGVTEDYKSFCEELLKDLNLIN